jgi:WD40 repeat protein
MRPFYFLIIFFFCLIFITNAQSDQLEYQAHHKDDITAIEFSPNANYIVSGSWDESIIIQRNDSTHKVMQKIQDNRGAIRSISFSRDGYHMITGGQDGKLNVYHFNDSFFSIATLDTTLIINQSQINKLIYGPGMRTIFSAGDDGRFIAYDIAKDRVIPIKTSRPISAAGVAIDRMSYFIAHEKKADIIQYDIMGRKLKSFLGHTDQITDILVTIDRKYIISSSEDKTVRIWEIRSGKELFAFKDHRWTVTDIATDPLGKYLVSGSLDGTVHLYHLKNRELIKTFNLAGYKINALAFSPNYTNIAVAAQKDESSDFAGYFLLETNLKHRAVKIPKRYIVKKQPKKKKLSSPLINKPSLVNTKEINSLKKDINSNKIKPKSNEKVIKKTDQIEIRID